MSSLDQAIAEWRAICTLSASRLRCHWRSWNVSCMTMWSGGFRDVHGIETDLMSDLVLALQLAGWSEQRIARYSAIELDGAIDHDSPEYEEHTNKILEFAKADDVYIGPDECAFALIQELTRSFPSESPAENVVGKLQLHVSYDPDVDPEKDPNVEPVGRLRYETKGIRYVLAISELTLTALQELFNSGQSGIDRFPWV